MQLIYKYFHLKNQPITRKRILIFNSVFIFHMMILFVNDLGGHPLPTTIETNHTSHKSDFTVSNFDTFPPTWLQNFFSRIFRKKKSLPVYNHENHVFPRNDLMKNKSPCQVDFDGFDVHVGESQKRLSFETLFTYAHQEVRNRYPGKDMLRTEVRCVERNNDKVDLSLRFTWYAENPQRFYGNFRNKHPLEIKLMDGSIITLYNRTSGSWTLSEEDNSYTMLINYALPAHHIKTLEKSFISDVRIYWERGYEDYPIHNIGVVMDQLDCL